MAKQPKPKRIRPKPPEMTPEQKVLAVLTRCAGLPLFLARERMAQLTEPEKCQLVALHDDLDKEPDKDKLGALVYLAMQQISERLEPPARDEEEEETEQDTELAPEE